MTALWPPYCGALLCVGRPFSLFNLKHTAVGQKGKTTPPPIINTVWPSLTAACFSVYSDWSKNRTRLIPLEEIIKRDWKMKLCKSQTKQLQGGAATPWGSAERGRWDDPGLVAGETGPGVRAEGSTRCLSPSQETALFTGQGQIKHPAPAWALSWRQSKLLPRQLSKSNTH